ATATAAVAPASASVTAAAATAAVATARAAELPTLRWRRTALLIRSIDPDPGKRFVRHASALVCVKRSAQVKGASQKARENHRRQSHTILPPSFSLDRSGARRC